MITRSSISIARPVAEAATDAQRLLSPSSEVTPVGVVVGNYPEKPAGLSVVGDILTNANYSELTQQLHRFHNDGNQMAQADFDRLVSLVSGGLSKMLYQIREVLVPDCKRIQQNIEDWGQPSKTLYSVDTHRFNAAHSDGLLMGHLQDRYENYRLREKYPTPAMDLPALETLVPGMASQLPSRRQELEEWLLSLDSDIIKELEARLFHTSSTVESSDWIRYGNEQIWSLDKLLVGYLMTMYLVERPQTTRRLTYSLEEWSAMMTELNDMFGALLLRSYSYRAKLASRQQLVLTSIVKERDNVHSDEPLVQVIVNGDVFPSWLEQGHDVRILLGAAIESSTVTTLPELVKGSEEFIKTWESQHVKMEYQALQARLRSRREKLTTELFSLYRDRQERDMTDEETQMESSRANISVDFRRKVSAYMDLVDETSFDNIWSLITDAVCTLFYPGMPYLQFLRSMDRAGQDRPTLTGREAATIATVEMLGLWLGQQIRRTNFEPVPYSDGSKGGEGVATHDETTA